MKKFRWLVPLLLAIITACQPTKATATIFADGQTYVLTTAGHTAAEILSGTKLAVSSNDCIFYLGSPVTLDSSLPDVEHYTLTVRRAITLNLVTPEGQRAIQTCAQTVGQALTDAGFTLFAADRLDPPAETPIEASLTVTYLPSRLLFVKVDGELLQCRSSASTVGQALAEAGVPLIGLDSSIPPENDPLPADGKILVRRVVESVSLTQKSIPFATHTEPSADLELDQQALLQGGEPGLAVSRVRSRSENGVQVSQITDSESIIRPPQDRILGYGTRVVIRTTTVDGVTIEYWRALTLYATYYIPTKIPGTDTYHGTSSGKVVKKGIVALVYPWYLLFGGEPLYIPGYGFASVEDNNGANTSSYWGTYWIDLGFSPTDTVDWDSHYVTVYFLTPVPSNVASTYLLP